MSPRLTDSTAMNQISATAPPCATSPDICAMRSGPPISSAGRAPMIICHTAVSVPLTRLPVSWPARHTAEDGGGAPGPPPLPLDAEQREAMRVAEVVGD